MNTFLETRGYGSDFPVSAFYSNDVNFLAHWHIDVEMVLVCEGSIRIGVNKEAKVLGAGEMAVCGSTDIHYYDSKERHSTVILLQFRPELVGSPGGWPEDFSFDPAFIDLQRAEPSIRRAIREIFRDLAAEMQETTPSSYFYKNGRIISVPNQSNEKKPFYQLYVKGKIHELCALLLRHFPTSPAASRKKNNKLPDIQKIQCAIEYMAQNYARDISLSEIAAVSNFSPYHFSRLFHQFTGIPFHQYLSRIRIAQAEQLIKANQKPMIEIAFDCGFNSVRTFNRTFKAVKGFPPSRGKE